MRLSTVDVNLPIDVEDTRKNETIVYSQNKYQFLKKIDQLPTRPKWVCEVIHITGNKQNMNSTCKSEELELWRRDPVDCVAQLLGDPHLRM
jgi:hypothetical protein